MNTVVLAAGGTCPIAPGATFGMATRLLQMSVLGLPLLLSLFQFVNAHKYPEPEEELSMQTLAYSAVMMTSAFMLWSFYFAAFCVIQTHLGSSQLTTLLFLFMWVMLAIIGIILGIQLDQMVGEDARYSLAAYLSGVALLVLSPFQSNIVFSGISVLLAILVIFLGVVKQFWGLPILWQRINEGWEAWNEWRQRMGSDD